ncbi:hypothetical protein FIBSPDRAFT_1053949 [Athelia psychrophila]|uniref:MYND-type domain-containing protein n=1 Tax=Athelia psychrophila TaxID=1759441 RepID=A0A167W545_9AGAM|nr:hypothetical protein FIBSPDRAFT_1053949 [Fibularhizoctonia sp. CBS 109695]
MGEFSSSTSIRLWLATIVPKSFEQPQSFLCTPALHYACRFIRAHDNWTVGMRKDYPETLDAMVAFLLTTQKASEAKVFEREWSHCRLAQTKGNAPMIAMLHETIHKNAVSVTFKELVAEICSFLSEVIDDIPVAPSDGFWPNSLDTALFPSGAKDAVLALTKWFIRVRDTGPLELLCTLLCHLPSGSALDTALFDTPEFIEAVVLEFKTVAEGKPDPILTYGRFWRNFLRAIGAQQYPALREYLRPNGVMLYKSIDRASAPFRSTESPVDIVVTSCYMLFYTFLVDVVPPSLSEDNMMTSPYSLVYPRTADQKKCAREGCSHSSLSTLAELKTCGGCRTVRYCSPKCQQIAWKWKPAPHRFELVLSG